MADTDIVAPGQGERALLLGRHDVCLTAAPVRLRPMTEDDWSLPLRWNSDAEVLYYCEGDDVEAYSLEDVQGIYRSVSQTALCFIIEVEGAPVGECWLQQMNLDWVRDAFPGQDLRRIDIMLGEKSVWGHSVGSTAIGLLCRHAFEVERADAVFGCSIADYNPRSQRAFARNRFSVWRVVPEPPGRKAGTTTYMVLTREEWLARQ